MVFQVKKLNTETLSEYLVAVRTGLGLSMDTVEQNTAVPVKFIKMLETGHFTELPPDTYVSGFLKTLANTYGIDSSVLIKQFKKERGIATRLQKSNPGSRKSSMGGIAFTPKRLGVSVLSLFVLLTAGYVLYEVRMVNQTPFIEIATPRDGSPIPDSFVQVAGKTNSGNELSINGKNVFVNDTGVFTTTVSIGSGQTNLRLVAKNKFDKVTEKSISIVGSSDPGEEAVSPIPASVNITVEALETITIALTVDGNTLPPETIEKGATKQIGAEDTILLSTSNAGRTKVVLNGQKLGVLGQDGEILKDVPFTVLSGLVINANSTRN